MHATTHKHAPRAAGTVQAFLNGADIRGLLTLPVLGVKVLGLVAVRAVGLAAGPEVGSW